MLRLQSDGGCGAKTVEVSFARLIARISNNRFTEDLRRVTIVPIDDGAVVNSMQHDHKRSARVEYND